MYLIILAIILTIDFTVFIIEFTKGTAFLGSNILSKSLRAELIFPFVSVSICCKTDFGSSEHLITPF